MLALPFSAIVRHDRGTRRISGQHSAAATAREIATAYRASLTYLSSLPSKHPTDPLTLALLYTSSTRRFFNEAIYSHPTRSPARPPFLILTVVPDLTPANVTFSISSHTRDASPAVASCKRVSDSEGYRFTSGRCSISSHPPMSWQIPSSSDVVEPRSAVILNDIVVEPTLFLRLASLYLGLPARTMLPQHFEPRKQ